MAWESLSSIPDGKRTYVCCLDETNNTIYAVSNHQGLLKYSLNTNTWITHETIDNLPSIFIKSYNDSAIINIHNKILYICTRDGTIAKLKLDDKKHKWNLFNSMTKDIGYGPQAIIINDELHVIGGDVHYNYHSIAKFNITSHEYQKVNNNMEKALNSDKIYYHRCIKLKNKLLLFGGFQNGRGGVFGDGIFRDTILEYDIINNDWKRLSQTLPVGLERFGCCSVLNGELILLFGGTWRRGNQSCDDI